MKKNNLDDVSLFRMMVLACLDERQQNNLKGIDVFEEIGSTNEYLLSAVNKSDFFPRVCFACSQTQGRGRRGRQWVSRSRQNIYMSLAYEFHGLLQSVSCLSLVVAIALVRVLRRHNIRAGIKWPNDVLVDGQKIAGILLESKIKSSNQLLLVVGIGLNVEMSVNQKIDQAWTDVSRQLSSGSSTAPDRNTLAGELLSEVMQAYDDFILHGFSFFKREWQSLDICYGADLLIKNANEFILAKGLGVDDDACLLAEVEGEVRRFHEAEVKVRISSCC